ncbi:MAG: glycosyltransferase [Bacteroidota bacterium]
MMKLHNVINIVADVSPVNFGVWKAATVGAAFLRSHGVESSLWVTSGDVKNANSSLETISIDNFSVDQLAGLVKSKQLSPNETIIVTHGSWLKPTRFGYELAKVGFRWVYVPQGMLEPWSFNQKKLKKKIYYTLFENKFIQRATAVRAVSAIEQKNLNGLLNRSIQLIPNGVPVHGYSAKPHGTAQFLYMARLHYKKGIFPLVKAWDKSMRDADAKLVICGYDEGELEKIRPFINGNIEYLDFVSGDDKIKLLKGSHYIVLPTSSEGLPSGVLEGMSFGLIPVISDGCNLPEVFKEHLGVRVEQDENNIAEQLTILRNKPFDQILSKRNHDYIGEHFSEDRTGEKLLELYRHLTDGSILHQ